MKDEYEMRRQNKGFVEERKSFLTHKCFCFKYLSLNPLRKENFQLNPTPPPLLPPSLRFSFLNLLFVLQDKIRWFYFTALKDIKKKNCDHGASV